jgi:hypothetical protein
MHKWQIKYCNFRTITPLIHDKNRHIALLRHSHFNILQYSDILTLTLKISLKNSLPATEIRYNPEPSTRLIKAKLIVG